MTRGTEQVPVITSLRDELGALRTDGGISEQFANWHRRLMASLHSIAAETPSCASLCEELKMVNYELPPEIEHGIPPGVTATVPVVWTASGEEQAKDW